MKMREILFRGKRKDNGEWVKGSFWDEIPGELGAIATYGSCVFHHIDLTTMGQFTGLTDKNGKKIFEGDIIKIPDDYNEFGHNAGEIYEIYFCLGGFRLKPKYSKARGYWLEDDRTVEVIGNIHDNPELLED